MRSGVLKVFTLAWAMAAGLGAWSQTPEACAGSLESPNIVAGSNQFTFTLMQRLAQENPGESFVASPLNVYTLLGLIMQGARGDTYNELASQLSLGSVQKPQLVGAGLNQTFGPEPEMIHDAERRQLLNDWKKFTNFFRGRQPKGIELSSNVGLWTDPSAPLLQSFSMAAHQGFGAQTESELLSTETFRAKVNSWISNETNESIPEMLAQKLIEGSVVALISATYFKGDWNTPFPVENTRPGNFKAAKGIVPNVPFMNNRMHADIATALDAEILRLPYGEDLKYSMILALPNPGISAEDLLKTMKARTLRELQFRYQDTIVTIPKFKIDFKTDQLIKSLQAIGLTDTFGASPHLSGLVEGPLVFTQGIHRAVIEVDEKGSKAAGAAVIGATRGMGSASVRFTADRSFVYFIREEKSGLILFSGIYQGK